MVVMESNIAQSHKRIHIDVEVYVYLGFFLIYIISTYFSSFTFTSFHLSKNFLSIFFFKLTDIFTDSLENYFFLRPSHTKSIFNIFNYSPKTHYPFGRAPSTRKRAYSILVYAPHNLRAIISQFCYPFRISHKDA